MRIIFDRNNSIPEPSNRDRAKIIISINELKSHLITLEVGSQLGSIVKDSTADSNNYIVQVVIDDKDIADLKVGSAVKLKVNSISYKEYGTIDGEIMRVSADVSIDQETGKSFYIAEASVNKESLKNSKGEEKEIKAGMQCQVQLLKDKKTLFKLL